MNPFDLKDFSERLIKIIRDEYKVSPRKFAIECGISPTTLQNYLPPAEGVTGKQLSQPSAEAIVKIAIFTRKTTDLILTGEDYSHLTPDEKDIIDFWRNREFRQLRKKILETEERIEQEEAARTAEEIQKEERRAKL